MMVFRALAQFTRLYPYQPFMILSEVASPLFCAPYTTDIGFIKLSPKCRPTRFGNPLRQSIKRLHPYWGSKMRKKISLELLSMHTWNYLLKTKMSSWTHLIRFSAVEDGQVHLGQLVDPTRDIGQDSLDGLSTHAFVIEGSIYDGRVTERKLEVKQVCPRLLFSNKLCKTNSYLAVVFSHRSIGLYVYSMHRAQL